MSAHTPGPWKCSPISDRVLNHRRGFEIRGPESEIYVRDVREDEIEPNARLIAAAPEMADALEMFLSGFSGDDVRLLAVGLFGSAVTEHIHQKCDHVNEALRIARTALRKVGRIS